jgi:hypothetical protein
VFLIVGIRAMKKAYRGTRMVKRMMTPEEIRKEFAGQFEAVARRIHRVCDDMEALGIEHLDPVPPGILGPLQIMAAPGGAVEKQFELKLKRAVEEKARRDARTDWEEKNS